MKKALKIRAHHLLCMQGYQGYGYDRKFEAGMSAVLDMINRKPDINIMTAAGNDIICGHCPHGSENCCRRGYDSDSKMKDMDKMILEMLKLKENRIYRADRLFSLVKSRFQTILDIKGICDYCEWRDKCLWFTSLKRDRL
jgi:uncharacterized protein